MYIYIHILQKYTPIKQRTARVRRFVVHVGYGQHGVFRIFLCSRTQGTHTRWSLAWWEPRHGVHDNTRPKRAVYLWHAHIPSVFCTEFSVHKYIYIWYVRFGCTYRNRTTHAEHAHTHTHANSHRKAFVSVLARISGTRNRFFFCVATMINRKRENIIHSAAAAAIDFGAMRWCGSVSISRPSFRRIHTVAQNIRPTF